MTWMNRINNPEDGIQNELTYKSLEMRSELSTHPTIFAEVVDELGLILFTQELKLFVNHFLYLQT